MLKRHETLRMFWKGGKESVKVSNWNEGRRVAEEMAKKLGKEVEVSYTNGVSTGYGLVDKNGNWS